MKNTTSDPLEYHEYAELFPIMPPGDMKEFVEDVKHHGLRHPIILFEGKILDGRHRYEACQQSGITPKFETYKGGDPIGLVLSVNLNRRHLSTSQRAMVAAKLADMPAYRPENKCANLRTSQSEAAETLGVSRRAVQQAAKIADESPKLTKQIEQGKITVNGATQKLAEKKSKADPEAQLDRVGRPIPSKILELWNISLSESKIAMDMLSKVRCALRAAQESENPAYREMNFSATLSHLNSAYGDFQRLAPYAVCHSCQGIMNVKCSACKGRGFVSKYFWDMCVPEEFKTIISKQAA